MDALATTRERAVEQWDMYDKILADNTKLKTYAVIGNHDVWGWSAKEQTIPPTKTSASRSRSSGSA